MSNTAKHFMDAFFAICAVVGIVVSKLIPVLAATASLIWYCTRLYDRFKGKNNGNVGND